MEHSINRNPPKIKICVFCRRFVRISGSNTVECSKFGNNSPARETQCAFWEREPGADDEVDAEFWRAVMERLHPPRKHPELQPRTLAETRAIMGASDRASAAWALLPSAASAIPHAANASARSGALHQASASSLRSMLAAPHHVRFCRRRLRRPPHSHPTEGSDLCVAK